MKKPTATDRIVEELSSYLTESAPTPDEAQIVGYLQHRSNMVVAKAAACAARHQLKSTVPLLVSAFTRFSMDGAHCDKGCLAKKALVKALDRLDFQEQDWFAEASRCVQIEPTYGGTVDTAVDTRCAAIRATSRFPWYSVSYSLVEHLGDTDPRARIAAVESLASFGGREAELVILAKTVSGDSSPEVIACCFSALLSLHQDTFLPLVARHLFSEDDAVRIEAAFALGQIRTEESFAVLQQAWDQWPSFEMKKVLIGLYAAQSTPKSLQFLSEIAQDNRFLPTIRKSLEDFPDEVRRKVFG